MDHYLTPAEEQRLSALFEEKRRLLKQKGHYTHRQLENAFHQRSAGAYLKDLIFGANDGIVTTFAVVAGAAGANLQNFIIVIMGFANLIGDGLSMGLANFLGEQSDEAYDKGQREKELWEVERFPEIERAEVKGILHHRYGFEGKLLDDVLSHLSADPKRWVDFMMLEELGIVEVSDVTSDAAKHGFAMFLAFVVAGLVPLLPFLIPGLKHNAFPLSVLFAGVTFFIIGSLRSLLTPTKWWKAGFQVFVVGSIASGAAYLIGKVLEGIVK